MKLAALLVGAWFSLALIAYGIALERRSERPFSSVHINDVGPTSGAVVSSRKLGARIFGMSFRVEGFPQSFEIPPEFVPDDSAWAELERSLVDGSTVWFKAAPDDQTVIQMRANYRTPREVEVIRFEHVSATRPRMSRLLARRSAWFFWSGIGSLGLFGAIYRLSRRRSVRRMSP